MKGYCSNSPVRCSIACSGEIVTSDDACCPKCLKSLIIVDVTVKDIEKIYTTLKELIVIVGMVFFIILIILFVMDLNGTLF